jgi:malonyl-CoA O-methyltransferase
MQQARPPTIDPVAAARWERRAPAQSPWLHEEVGRRMEERLEWINLRPMAWAHWEPVRGGLQTHGLVAKRYAQAECFVVEPQPEPARVARSALAKAWWNPRHWKGGATHFAAPPREGVQMLWANMALHMAADPQALIARWHAALAVDGFLMFSCLGPDTVHQLRSVYQEEGWPSPSQAFTDMHDWGDMLVQAGFAEPVMDMERITLTYETPAQLLQELRELGRNLHPQRFAALRARGWRQRLEQALARQLSDPAEKGRLPLTFEIIYGHALKPAPKMKMSAQSAVSLRDMRTMLQGGKRDAA